MLKAIFSFIGKILFLCVLPILYAIYPIWRFRFGHLPSDRIGHYAGNAFMFLRGVSEAKGLKRSTEFYAQGTPCNLALGEVVHRYLSPHVTILKSLYWARIYFMILPILKKTRFYCYMPWNNYGYKVLNTNGHFKFTEKEEKNGQDLLRKMGIGPDDWFVCFHARDASYLYMKHGAPNVNHDFRDGNILNYQEAMNWITAQGGYAIRMGSLVSEALPKTKNSRIVDYATECRSDFGDIYLSARCRFYLGTGSGLIIIPLVFGTPYAAVNMVPYVQPIWTKGALFTPKRAVDSNTGRALTFQELRDKGLFTPDGMRFYRSSDYEDAGITLIENDPSDILGVCRDMFRITGGEASTNEFADLQARYKALLVDVPEAEFAGDVAPSFLVRHQGLL